MTKNKGLGRGAEAPHYPSRAHPRLFPQPVKPCPFKSTGGLHLLEIQNLRLETTFCILDALDRDDRYPFVVAVFIAHDAAAKHGCCAFWSDVFVVIEEALLNRLTKRQRLP